MRMLAPWCRCCCRGIAGPGRTTLRAELHRTLGHLVALSTLPRHRRHTERGHLPGQHRSRVVLLQHLHRLLHLVMVGRHQAPPPHFSVGSWRWSGHGAASCGQLLPLPCDESQPFRIQPRINKIRITPRHIHPSRSVQGGAPASDVVGREVTERQLLQEKARAGMPRQAYSNPENNTTALAFRHARVSTQCAVAGSPRNRAGSGAKAGIS